jgi:hypothetical protein
MFDATTRMLFRVMAFLLGGKKARIHLAQPEQTLCHERNQTLSFTALLCGCTPMQWIRPNTTAEQTQQDGAECRIAAYGNYSYKELVVEHEHGATTTKDANQMMRDANAAQRALFERRPIAPLR